MSYRPEVVSWNITNRCNLRCDHCYLDASYLETGGNELGTEKCLEIVDQMADADVGILILTGGEPLLRQDIEEIIGEASKNMMVVLGTNGVSLTPERAEELKEIGVSGVGISIDSLEPGFHDSFRSKGGSWRAAVDAMETCREAGLDFTVQTTVSEQNFGDIEELAKLANERGARSFNLYFLVCTGRGEDLVDISPEMYEEAIERLTEIQGDFDDMMVRAKCAPHVKRVATDKDSSLLYSAGCMASTSYCRVTSEGVVTPCPYMPNEAGDLKQETFGEVWESSELFMDMRNSPLKGRCGECEYAETCFGCRARAFAIKNDYMEEDPWCTYEPSGEEFVDPEWSEGALNVLDKMPSFIEGTIKRGVESYAKKNGVETITREFFFEVAKKAKKRKG